MGVFAGMYGEVHVPPGSLGELTQRVLTVVQQGGMMNEETVKMFGKKISLIEPAKLDRNGQLSYNYNYFEDDIWETAGYDSRTGEVWSNKVGSAESKCWPG